jgi:hypothetical protein
MKCICCGAVIAPFDTEKPEHEKVFDYEHVINGRNHSLREANNLPWNGGVGIISAGYGSTHDGGRYVIGICDKCIAIKIADGTLAYIDNYLFRNKVAKDDLKEHREIWIKNNQ